jgi:mycofactocin precursor
MGISLFGGNISMNENEKEIRENEPETDEKKSEAIDELNEIVIEELAVDGVCGIY